MIIVMAAIAIRYERKLRRERTTFEVSLADAKHPQFLGAGRTWHYTAVV